MVFCEGVYEVEKHALQDLRTILKIRGDILNKREVQEERRAELKDATERFSRLPARLVIEVVVKAQSGNMPLRYIG